MKLPHLVILGLLLVASNCQDCYTFTCDTLDDLVCAIVYGSQNTVTLNDKGCSYLTCNHTYVEDAVVKSQATGDTINLPCFVGEETENNKIQLDYYVKCETRTANRDLVNGTFPKTCNTTDDCKLKDGDYADCLCGMDGNKYCYADKSSELYEDFWTVCSNHDGQMYYRDMLLWNYTVDNYITLYSAPFCAENLFPEYILNLNFIVDSSMIKTLGFLSLLVHLL
ncbi:unnamed protein product [Blepharisma stoltei]|uniref:Sodefrin-like factor n=1 Tax=Blepharisma stoltei TaxID=1481888 RepID=A0AAU9IH07_9CILI|nr:unnamed protein product [Blepharisma stoltei]